MAEALGPVPPVATGSPYAVSPPRLTTKSGLPYKVFTPFYRAWREHGWPEPASSDPGRVDWVSTRGEAIPDDPMLPSDLVLPSAGERSAQDAWRKFREERLRGYPAERDRPDVDADVSAFHIPAFRRAPPTHAPLGTGARRRTLHDRAGMARFYAAVLWSWPESARSTFDARMSGLAVDGGPDAEALFECWAEGRTGYPIIDAGMRQLKAEAWMHNRVRMLVASFLVKDLHLDWRWGARHFMRHLVDGDLASNQHGWQWTAGTGTDASPYFRIFNPVTQSKRFDPDGDYIRRWIPELRNAALQYVHEPWRSPIPIDYVDPIVDHARERKRSLAGYALLRSSASGSRSLDAV